MVHVDDLEILYLTIKQSEEDVHRAYIGHAERTVVPLSEYHECTDLQGIDHILSRFSDCLAQLHQKLQEIETTGTETIKDIRQIMQTANPEVQNRLKNSFMNSILHDVHAYFATRPDRTFPNNKVLLHFCPALNKSFIMQIDFLHKFLANSSLLFLLRGEIPKPLVTLLNISEAHPTPDITLANLGCIKIIQDNLRIIKERECLWKITLVPETAMKLIQVRIDALLFAILKRWRFHSELSLLPSPSVSSSSSCFSVVHEASSFSKIIAMLFKSIPVIGDGTSFYRSVIRSAFPTIPTEIETILSTRIKEVSHSPSLVGSPSASSCQEAGRRESQKNPVCVSHHDILSASKCLHRPIFIITPQDKDLLPAIQKSSKKELLSRHDMFFTPGASFRIKESAFSFAEPIYVLYEPSTGRYSSLVHEKSFMRDVQCLVPFRLFTSDPDPLSLTNLCTFYEQSLPVADVRSRSSVLVAIFLELCSLSGSRLNSAFSKSAVDCARSNLFFTALFLWEKSRALLSSLGSGSLPPLELLLLNALCSSVPADSQSRFTTGLLSRLSL